MAIKTFQISAGAVTATPIINPATTPTHKTPVQELHLNPSSGDYYFGNADVSSTKYFRKVASTGVTAIVGNGPAALAIDVLENLYVLSASGTITINIGAVTL